MDQREPSKAVPDTATLLIFAPRTPVVLRTPFPKNWTSRMQSIHVNTPLQTLIGIVSLLYSDHK